MPEPLYVRHDRGLLNQVTSWLLQDQHIGLVSPYGTGKTAFREILRRDLGERDDFVVAYVENPADTTPRGLYERVLRAAFAAGYEIDTSDYWQVNDGIPWATDETKQAVEEVTDAVRADGKTILLVVDELEDLSESLLPAIQVAGDAGVRLFLSGTPTGKERLADVRATLDSRVRFYDGIEPFGPAEVTEYVERSLAYFRGEPYEGQSRNCSRRPPSRTSTSERTGTPGGPPGMSRAVHPGRVRLVPERPGNRPDPGDPGTPPPPVRDGVGTDRRRCGGPRRPTMGNGRPPAPTQCT